jgi:iron(III) transport system ATP-binding protein
MAAVSMAARSAAASPRPADAGSAEAPAPYLRIRGLRKTFGGFTSLQHVDLDVREGEFVSFLGPSGCGKTTLLRAISGLDIQTEGSISQGGRDISTLPVEQRDFGIVFQSYALFPNLTVRANVGYGLVAARWARSRVAARVEELLALVGLSDQAAKYPAQLSGGQQQRVALARALALSPGLLLLDEPLSALDARVRARLRGELRDLQQRLGITTIMVTHDQEEALTMSDRIVVMNHGRIDQVGTPDEIYGQPATAFVADFVGKMNFLAGRLVDGHNAEVGGARLAFTMSVDAAPGSAVTVCLRPEDVALRDAALGQTNAFEMRVGVMEFIGNHFATTLHAVGTSLNVSADLSMNAVRDLGIQPGGLITVRLPADRLRVFLPAED